MKTLKKVTVLYIVAILLYAVWIHAFSIPVHFEVDEELYISMAKSFHYTGKFMHEGVVLDYSCVLYSMILSIAYFFYTPSTIMFSLRMVGVIVMLSSVFPIFLLGEKALGDEKKSFILSCLFCILPSATNVAYCMQEVLCYPLFLWLIYFLYCEIQSEKICKISQNFFCISALAVLCYFTKTYMIFVPLVYCLFICLNSVLQKNREGIVKVVTFGGIYGILYLVGKKIILLCNQGDVGYNHYAGQFSNLFPIKADTIMAAISCCIIYLAALLFYWGLLPIFLPAFNWKKYDKQDRQFGLFLIASFLILIAEVVISVVLTEEGNVLFPHKILYRYFQILEIPVLLMFLKKIDDFEIPRWIWILYLLVLGVLTIYYVCIGKNQRTAIIDAPLFLLMENINRYIIPYFNILACGASALVISAAVILKKKGKIRNYCHSFIRFSLAITIGFFLINMVQLPLYTNIVAKGTDIENSAMELAKQLENAGYNSYIDAIGKVYYDTAGGGYTRAMYAYLKADVINLSEEYELLYPIEEKDCVISWDETAMQYQTDLQ